MTESQRKRIRELAEFCKVGASDPLVIEIMNRGLKHMGRDTAIRIAALLENRGKRLNELTQQDVVGLFPENKETAILLFEEISAVPEKGA
jgi:ribosome biogenesis SPOUT family RNA methylase Rps3